MIRPMTILLLVLCVSTLQAQELEDPRNILRERTAKYWHELDISDDETGVESNPTGNPIGGGEGYSDIITRGDYTVRSYEDLASALEQVRPGEVVYVPADAEIDFSGRPILELTDEVTLAGNRGSAGSSGGRLFSDELDTDLMLRVTGDYARITGLRIRGPFDERWRVPIGSDGVGISGFGVEFDNNEISAFSHAAISVSGRSSRTYIHHNYIHHNQRDGLGYGTSSGGADILYEANLYDYNRHHIASSGSPGSAYEARYNLVRPNANSHLFDMHGGRDRGDMTAIAGDWLHVHHNTFESEERSLVIRGVPSQGAWVHNNWILRREEDEDDPMIDGEEKLYLYDNAFGPDKSPYVPIEGDH
jgi:hypothetical protein